MVKKHPTHAQYVQETHIQTTQNLSYVFADTAYVETKQLRDSLIVKIVGTYKPDYFEKKLGVLIQPKLDFDTIRYIYHYDSLSRTNMPVMVYDSAKQTYVHAMVHDSVRLFLKSMILKGESAKQIDADSIISYAEGGTFVYTDTIPYRREHDTARLVLRPVVFTQQDYLANRTAIAWYPAGVLLDKNPGKGIQGVPLDTAPIVWQLDLEMPPSIKWIYWIEYEENPEDAWLMARAVMKNGFELPSEQPQQEPFKSTVVTFMDMPEHYEKVGPMTVDKEPLQKDVLIANRQVPLTYYNDTVTYRQPIKIKSPIDFKVPADADYVGLNPNDNAILPRDTNASRGLIPVRGLSEEKPPIAITEKPTPVPSVIWTYYLEPTNDPEKANLVAKAVMINGFELTSEKPQEKPFFPTVVKFQDMPEHYENDGPMNVNKQPLQQDLLIDKRLVPLTYYKDSVIFRQPIRIKSPNDFKVAASATYICPCSFVHAPSSVHDTIKPRISTGLIPVRVARPALTIKDVDGYQLEIADGFILYDVYYDFDIGDFISKYTRELDIFLEVARNNPHLKFEVTSHTDERGSFAYNEELSQRRLKSVMAYVTARGLDPNRVIGRAAGKRELQYVHAANEEEHALNRRTTIRMWDPSVAGQQQPTQEFSRTTTFKQINPRNEKGLVFRVQIGAASEMPTHPNYLFRNQLNAAPGVPLSYYRDDRGWYIFIMGEYTDPVQARRLSQRITEIGKQNFVTAYLDGKKILLSEGEAIFKRNQGR
jgi:hypothetical protein